MTPPRPSGRTQIFGIFGYPVRHTLSPQMHHAAFEALGLQHAYLPFEVHPDQLKKAVESIVPLGIRGVNVTLPHKKNVIPFLDQIDPEAEKMGAVNTIKNEAGRLIGFNTDGRGFVASLREAGVDPAGMTVLLIGAGGAARGVSVALLDAGVSEIHILARRVEAGLRLAEHLKSFSPGCSLSSSEFDFRNPVPVKGNAPVLLINSTPLGMKPEDPYPFPLSQIEATWVIADLIYRPYETALLTEAKKIGAKTVPGLGMLLYQGALAFEIWTGQKPPIGIMRQALLAAFS